jgi:heme O synthase-like polyprenyltransferase
VAASLVSYWTGLSGLLYLLAAGLLGLAFIVCAILLRRSLSEGRARLLLKAGVIYLPCLLIAMVTDRV